MQVAIDDFVARHRERLNSLTQPYLDHLQLTTHATLAQATPNSTTHSTQFQLQHWRHDVDLINDRLPADCVNTAYFAIAAAKCGWEPSSSENGIFSFQHADPIMPRPPSPLRYMQLRDRQNVAWALTRQVDNT